MNGDLISALKQIERERNIPIEILKEAVEQALTSSYRKTFGAESNIRVEIGWETGGIKVVATLNIVPRKKHSEEISLSQARKKLKKGQIVKIHPMDPELLPNIDGEPIVPEEDELFLGMNLDVIIEENPKNFGRIAAQTTKQVIIQKIREAERDIIFNEYAEREGDIMSGIIQRSEHRNWIVDLGRIEGIIPPHEQVYSEHFRKGERLKVYVLKVEQGTRGPQVILSRTHPNLIRRIFETEIPEIAQGLIEIQNVVREPGARSKVAVRAVEANVDPLGACVGPRGSRVQMIVDELRGEKIDIISYTDDPFTFVSNSLSPARVLTVTLDPDDRTALVMVPDSQYSLAIGKEGQNARLAAKLTGWKIDIKNETQMREIEEQREKEEEERRAIEKEEQEKLEEEERKRNEEEEQIRREEEEKRQKEEEDQLRIEEEKQRLEEEERKRLEEEERNLLLENPPEIDEYLLKPEEQELVKQASRGSEENAQEIDEYLKEIPKDIPIEQYITMAFKDGSSDRSQDYLVRTGHNASGNETESSPKKSKKKKKKRRGQDFDDYYG